jgi:hypothetical protein
MRETRGSEEEGSAGAKITAEGFQFLLRPLQAQVSGSFLWAHLGLR